MTYYLYPVRFSHTQKNAFYKSEFHGYEVGDKVVCETNKGIELGVIMHSAILNENIDLKLIPNIERRASESDVTAEERNVLEAKKALEIFFQEAKAYNLDLQPVSCFFTLDREKIVFTYLATERVDFRELLKSLAKIFRTRIDLRQINSRDRAQFVGGVGVCGLPLCCTTFLNDFEGITVQKTKNQMLTINSTKINGLCGKLLCCLKYEDEVYTIERKDFPPLGTTFKRLGKEFKIVGFNIISRNVKLESEDGISNEPLEEVLNAINPKKEHHDNKHRDKRDHPRHRDHRQKRKDDKEE